VDDKKKSVCGLRRLNGLGRRFFNHKEYREHGGLQLKLFGVLVWGLDWGVKVGIYL